MFRPEPLDLNHIVGSIAKGFRDLEDVQKFACHIFHPLITSRKTYPLRSTPMRLAVPCDWVVTRGLLRGRFWLCRMTCTRRES
jgi:hypothetical protein